MKFISVITLSIGSLIFLGLSGCSSPQKIPEQSTPQALDPNQTDNQINPEDDIERLKELIQDDISNQNWVAFVERSELLWQKTPTIEQGALEQSIWDQLNQIFNSPYPSDAASMMLQLTESGSEIADAWALLLESQSQRGLWQAASIKQIMDFNPEISFSHHLGPRLYELASLPGLAPSRIAVLLPFEGVYEDISRQIRNGIIQNQLYNYPNTELRFFNVKHPSQVKIAYENAVNQGADVVIGPLTKQAIASLSDAVKRLDNEDIQLPKTLILNQVERTPFEQFNFKSRYEADQISKQLCFDDHRHIGILSNTSKSNAALAMSVQDNWLSNPLNTATLKTYPTKRPNLRKSLGGLINEAQSQARKNNLTWLLKKDIEFTPRSRQDLDAIVIVGNERNIAVFRPQFKFFDLTLPVYGTSLLTPKNDKENKPNLDLTGVHFPTYRSAIEKTPTKTIFEAFGWDSLTIVMEPDSLYEGLYYQSGMTGALTKIDPVTYDRNLKWAKYDAQGRLQPLNP